MSSLHKTSTAACILLLIVVLAFASVERTSITDQTLISFASGADVVDACIQKINQNGLFTYDEKLLERIAITESGYTYKNKKDGGIWQLTLEHFKETKDHISPYLEESIRQMYGYEWKSMKWVNLTTPFLSALAARLYINQSLHQLPLSSNVLSQAVYWANNYTKQSQDASKYIEAVRHWEKIKGIYFNET